MVLTYHVENDSLPTSMIPQAGSIIHDYARQHSTHREETARYALLDSHSRGQAHHKGCVTGGHASSTHQPCPVQAPLPGVLHQELGKLWEDERCRTLEGHAEKKGDGRGRARIRSGPLKLTCAHRKDSTAAIRGMLRAILRKAASLVPLPGAGGGGAKKYSLLLGSRENDGW